MVRESIETPAILKFFSFIIERSDYFDETQTIDSVDDPSVKFWICRTSELSV